MSNQDATGFPIIDRLMSEGFYFQSWDDRYGRGVWAALGTHESEVDTVRNLSNAGDCDAIPAMEHMDSGKAWLPYATGRTFLDAVGNLEKHLSALPIASGSPLGPWRRAVYEAIDALRQATDGKSYYAPSQEKRPDALNDLPKKFEEAVSGSVK